MSERDERMTRIDNAIDFTTKKWVSEYIEGNIKLTLDEFNKLLFDISCKLVEVGGCSIHVDIVDESEHVYVSRHSISLSNISTIPSVGFSYEGVLDG